MIFSVLAASEPASETGQMAFSMSSLNDFVWQQISSLTWFQAVIGISFGIVYLLYGWRIFRVLVVIAFGLVGMFLGIFFGQKFGGGTSSEVAGAVVGVVAFAIFAMSLIKWSVSILGAAAGGILTGGIWYAIGLPEQYMWAGAIIGVVAGGMMSFILLKISVMLFTSLGGAAILSISLLALFYQYENHIVTPPGNSIHEFLFTKSWFLPLAIIVPTVIGMIIQNKFIKQSDKWDF